PQLELAADVNGSGARVVSLIEAAGDAELGPVVEEHFGSLVSRDDPFVARNEASWTEGALIYVPRGAQLAAPTRIELGAEENAASGSRTLVVIEDGAAAEIWGRWSGGGGCL